MPGLVSFYISWLPIPYSQLNQQLRNLIHGLDAGILIPAMEIGSPGTQIRTGAQYIIRDHDKNFFAQKKEMFRRCADFLNQKYGEGTASVRIQDSYYNSCLAGSSVGGSVFMSILSRSISLYISLDFFTFLSYNRRQRNEFG